MNEDICANDVAGMGSSLLVVGTVKHTHQKQVSVIHAVEVEDSVL